MWVEIVTKPSKLLLFYILFCDVALKVPVKFQISIIIVAKLHPAHVLYIIIHFSRSETKVRRQIGKSRRPGKRVRHL